MADDDEAFAEDLSLHAWISTQQQLLAQQTENISSLANSVHKLASAVDRRPTLWKVIAIEAAMSILSNMTAVGVVLWARHDIRTAQQENAAASRQRGEEILALTKQLDDCLDTTTDDGDPVGECAAESQARLTVAIAQVTKGVTCAEEAFIIDFLSKNPALEISPPTPRPECDADGN